MDVEIVAGRRTHILPIAAQMPPHDLMPAKTALRALFHASAYCRAALLQGRPIALWGITGDLMADEGEAWLAAPPAARAMPFCLARQAVREMRTMAAGRRVIRSSLMCRDVVAQRFAEWLGFRVVGEPDPRGFFVAELKP